MATRLDSSKTTETGRLDASAWIMAALTLLSEQGIAGVRVEPLARRLGVTKGSFYWHFKDRDALLQAMLLQWRRSATLDVMERIERGHEPARQRIQRLLRLPILGRSSARGADVELAVRLWGRQDARARAALEEVDELRLRYIAGLFEECGVAKTDARARAIAAYSYVRVAGTLIDRADETMMERCEAFLIDV